MNLPDLYDYLTRARRDLWQTLEDAREEVLSKNLLGGKRFHCIKDLVFHIAEVEDGWIHGDLLRVPGRRFALLGVGGRSEARALPHLRAGSDSPQESRLRLRLVRAGLPEPQVNLPTPQPQPQGSTPVTTPAPAPQTPPLAAYDQQGFEGWKQGFLARKGGARRADAARRDRDPVRRCAAQAYDGASSRREPRGSRSRG